MDTRLVIAVMAAAVLFATAWGILYLTDRDKERAAAALSGVRVSAHRRELNSPIPAMVWVGQHAPEWLRRLVRRRPTRFPAIVPEARRTDWELARSGVAISGGLLLIALALLLNAPVMLAGVLVCPFIAASLIRRQLRRLETQRRERIDREFVTALDITVLAMEAGLPLERAIGAYVGTRSTELAAEFAVTTRDLEVGYRRKEALQRLEQRTGSQRLAAFAAAVRVAEDFGSPLAAQLRSLSHEVREQRKQRLQEMALKAPVTMLLPTAAFILPPIFAIVMGPMAIRLASGSLF